MTTTREELINAQRDLLENYRQLVESYNDRQIKMLNYLEAIYNLLTQGNVDEIKTGLEHLNKLITRTKEGIKK